jgi:hypothetical protein
MYRIKIAKMQNTYQKFSTVVNDMIKTKLSKQKADNFNDVCDELSATFRSAMNNQDFSLARKICEEALKIIPGNMTLLSDYALTLMREQKYLQAYNIYKIIDKAPISQQKQASQTWLDGLTEVCGWLDNKKEVEEYGKRSLQIADEKYNRSFSWDVRNKENKIFSANPAKNIISFSLFGAQPKYCETMIKNVLVAKELYPEWTCRVYLDNTVPEQCWLRLISHGAQLVDMSKEKDLVPTMWRFLVIDDKNIERYIIRDADALLSERESAAVHDWIESGKCFHHMRDYFSHTDLLLAGMWGGITGIFPSIYALMQSFVQTYTGNIRFTDQFFLKNILWSTIRKSLLNHDEIFHFYHAKNWPTHRPIRWYLDKFHVGCNVSNTLFSNTSTLEDGLVQKIGLEYKNDCYIYDAIVRSGSWHLTVPFFIMDDYKNGVMKIVELKN